MTEHDADLYDLSTGAPVTSLSRFHSPLDEYRAAFEDRASPFLNYYALHEGDVKRHTLTRGDFWDLACSAAECLRQQGLAKADRVIHGFSANSLYDLVFRLAEALTGSAPVTINWQADDNERILYKSRLTGAKLMLYDGGFAARVEEIRPALPNMRFLEASKIEAYGVGSQLTSPTLDYDDERIIIFTSGTTGRPKGVSLPYRSYLANRLTFERYFNMSENTRLDLLLVNPLHHSNSSAISDWGMRRRGTIIHLVERYSTSYWKTLVQVAESKRDLIIAPLVSRHFDFLESLASESKLPVEEARIKEALGQIDILIGSAPVGPTTISRILRFSNRLPHVRFGATEACLQVMATPIDMSYDELMKAFEAGWKHSHRGTQRVGYYIGREHFPFTRVKVVRSINPESGDFLSPCEMGEPGYLITQGPNIMSYYVGEPEATKSVLQRGWYTGLKDVVFALTNRGDGQLDYYWTSRESELLIRGGANYAYDQIAAQLSKVLVEDFGLKPEQFRLAVLGLRLESEHEDSCCVTIELGEEVLALGPQLKGDFIERASKRVSKSIRPDYVQFAPIPLGFKGQILYPQLKQQFLEALNPAK